MDRKEYLQKWRDDHKEQRKKWVKDNKSYFDQYRQEHREACNERSAQYFKDNPKYRNQWKKTEKGKLCNQMQATKRRSNKKKIINTLTLEEWEGILKQHDYKCIYCGKHFTMFEMTKDHIVPISKGGDNTKENIVPACMECNARMSDDLELKLRTLESIIKLK